MAKCPKCEHTTFVVELLKTSEGHLNYSSISCASCHTLVSVINRKTDALILQQEAKIKKLESDISQIATMVNTIDYDVRQIGNR